MNQQIHYRVSTRVAIYQAVLKMDISE